MSLKATHGAVWGRVVGMGVCIVGMEGLGQRSNICVPSSTLFLYYSFGATFTQRGQ